MPRRLTTVPLVAAAGWLIGSIPFAAIVAGVSGPAGGGSLRNVGTGTVSATNVHRVSGTAGFLVACLLDYGKGLAVAELTHRLDPDLMPLAAGATVAGHNWSLFLRGAGGRGVLPTLGLLTRAAPAGAAVLAAGVVAGFAAGDTAPTCGVAGMLLVPVLAKGGRRGGAALAAAVVVPMLIKRVMGNARPAAGSSRRVYLTRLIYDRDAR